MPIFQIDDKSSAHKEKAKAILDHANNIADHLKELFISSKNALWSVQGYTIEDAQKVLDEMDILSPGSSVASFQMHGEFGSFLNIVYPGALTEEELSAPVPYEIEIINNVPHIKLTGNKYPTEVSNEN